MGSEVAVPESKASFCVASRGLQFARCSAQAEACASQGPRGVSQPKGVGTLEDRYTKTNLAVVRPVPASRQVLWVHGAALLGFAMTAAWLAGCHLPVTPTPRPADRSIRAVWVTRWDYKTAREISAVMANCRRAGFNTVLFQVRGNGTVFYRSRIEPWADELGGGDPGFDPLAVACQEAHRRGLKLHAWVNVIPGWRGDKPPTNPRQLYHAHADWFWRDEAGRREPLGWYNNLNPCYPEVRRYLVDVMREIVMNYPVDGLHLDYMRFPNEWNRGYPRRARVPDYPRDPRTLALFRQASGLSPQQAPRQWNRWRAAMITWIVEGIRSMIEQTKPGIQLSAAVGASPDDARRRHHQDVRRWLSLGLLDAVYPMNYEKNMRRYAQRLAEWSAMRLPIPVVTGVMFDQRKGSLVIEQLDRARRRSEHFAAFAYNSLFDRLDQRGRPQKDKRSTERAALRRRVIPHMRRLAALRV